MAKVEHGIMVMRDGKAWGVVYSDGHSTSYGWMNPEDAPIHDPKYCKSPSDVTWEGSHYVEELLTGRLVPVIRTTTITVQETPQ